MLQTSNLPWGEIRTDYTDTRRTRVVYETTRAGAACETDNVDTKVKVHSQRGFVRLGHDFALLLHLNLLSSLLALKILTSQFSKEGLLIVSETPLSWEALPAKNCV